MLIHIQDLWDTYFTLALAPSLNQLWTIFQAAEKQDKVTQGDNFEVINSAKISYDNVHKVEKSPFDAS